MEITPSPQWAKCWTYSGRQLTALLVVVVLLTIDEKGYTVRLLPSLALAVMMVTGQHG